MDETIIAALMLIGVFIFVIGLPCVGTAFLGVKMVKRLANYPSKTPVIHLSVVSQLVVLELISFGLLLLLYHILADYGQGA